MRLIDLDQTIFVPIIDESKGGVKYEMQMTIAELFDKFFDGVQPEVVDAITVEWLNKQCEMADDRGDMEMTDAISWLIQMWQEEQEAR